MEQVYIGFARVASIPNLKSLESRRYEKLMPFYTLFMLVTSLPSFLLTFVVWVMERFTSEARLANRARGTRALSHEGVNGLY
jgi:hypothetical protein